jgi:alpha-2-macroglobulin
MCIGVVFILAALTACEPSTRIPLPGPTPTTSPTPAPTAMLVPLSVDVNQQQAVPPPYIVAQKPLAGQRLDLQPVIELTFDRDMNRQTSGAAWTFADSKNTPVPGSVSWVDARTFRFTPGARLMADAEYRGTFSTSASDANGKTLPAEIRIKFHTLTPLAVGEAMPADGTAEVDPNTSITVVFNRPVVPVMVTEDQASLPQPLEFSPQVSGHGQWANSSVYIFQPDRYLDSGTGYTARIAAGLKDASGNALEQDYTWQFTTREVTGSVRGMNFDHILLDQAIVVDFVQPMNADSVKRALSITDRRNGQPFPVTLEWAPDLTWVAIKPAGKYQIASFYELNITKAAQAKYGGNLSEAILLDFSSLPLPRIDSVTPSPDSQAKGFNPWITLQFSSPMNLDSLKNKVKIVPQPANKVTSNYDPYAYQLMIEGLEAGTDYVVTVLPGMADIYGNVIPSEYSFSFRTGDLSPYVALLTPSFPLVYRAKGEQDIFFEYTNSDSVDISLYPITFDEFSYYINPNITDHSSFTPAAESIRHWQPALQALKNRTVRTRLDFKDASGAGLKPGYYFIGLKAQPFDYQSAYLQGAVFIVSTDSLTFKTTPSESLVWLTDLETGAPTANVPVVIYDNQFNQIGRSTTDKNGLAYLDNLAGAWYARTEDGQHSAFVSQDWGSGVSTGQFGLWWNYYTDYSTRFVYVYTERPLYRPGQDVYITGIVRHNDDLHYSLPSDPTVYVTIDYYDEQVYAQSLTLDDQGNFTTTFHLDDAAALGSYDIKVYASPADTTKDPFGQISFRVAEYHKPEFQVLASSDKTDVLVGDRYTVALDASYYSGGPVGKAQVHWYTDTSPYYFQPSEDYSAYSFSDWDRDQYWSDPQAQTPAVTDEGNATTDAKGHVALSRVASLGKNTTSRQVQFYADVTASSGNVVGVHTSLVVHQSSLYAGIRSQQYIGEAGKAQNFQLVVLDWASKPASEQAVSVDIVERQWYSVQEQDAQGTVSWVTSVKDIPAAHFDNVATDADGKASVSFTPAAGGIYKATVTVQDAKLHTQQASTYLWVSGGEYVSWMQTNDRSFKLVADKDTYTPGDTAEILIAQPFKGQNYALVTVERGHIYSREVLRLTDNSTIYKLPITSEMTPATYVSVLVVSGAGTSGKPDFKVGLVRLNVDTSQQSLDVSISTDKATAGPGDKVTYTVKTTNLTGKPVAAEVSLALVDKAILALAPANSLPIVSAFYPVRALNVVTSVGIVENAEDFNANYTETAPQGEHSGGGGGGKGVGNEGIINVRENFRDTAFYQAQVKTDTKGVAQVVVSLPQNLTTWVMDARAAAADSRVGQATNELVSSKPMFVQLQTPRFFTTDDTARIGATVFNNSSVPLSVTVTLTAKGAALLAEANQTVKVEGNQQAYLTWDVKIDPAAARVDLLAHAVSGQYEDSSTPPLGTLDGQGIPVQAYQVTETVGTSGLLSQADSITEAVQMPATLPSSDAALSVALSPSLAASLQDSLTFLQEYPYSSIEETSSRLVANVITNRILATSGRSDATLQADLDLQVNTALQHIYANQEYDGGWGWWDSQSDLLTSTYVTYGLTEARESGFTVTDSVLSKAVQYLKDNLNVLDQEAASWQYNRQAFQVYVLTRAGEQLPGKITLLYDNREKLALYARAYLLQAIALQDPTDSRIATLKSDLNSAAVLSAAGTHWEETEADVWNWGSDLRTSAVVLNAFIQIDPQSSITANAVRWLVSSRTVDHWGSTQETTWTLTALSNWLIASHEFESNYRYAIGLNGKPLQDGTVTADNLTKTVTLQIGAAQMLKDGINYLVVTRGEGAGNLYYTAYLQAALPVAQIQPLDRGITVSRQYFSLTNDKTPITQIGRGEVVRVRVTVIAPDSLHYVLVNDPLPAGLEAIDTSLLTDVQVPSVYTYQDFSQRGWGWWFFSHVELHDEKVTLSADYLPAGTYVYTYLARASTAGTFDVIPTTAEELYFPDVAGRGAGSVFVVKP